MKQGLILLGICTASVSWGQSVSDFDPPFLNWSANTKASFNNSVDPFPLQNLSIKQYLRYGSRVWGINLEWDKGSVKSIRLVKPNFGSTEQNKFPTLVGQLCAMHVLKGGYLKYEKRSVGVNLGWSSTPVFEWRVIAVANPGVTIKPTMTIGLYNERVKDFLIYHERSAGINLGWASDDRNFNSKGRLFVKQLRDRHFGLMADLLKKLLDW